MDSVVSKPNRLPAESLLLDVADVLATSLDLDTTLRRVAEVVRKVIDYEIFAILLLNEKTRNCVFVFKLATRRNSQNAAESKWEKASPASRQNPARQCR